MPAPPLPSPTSLTHLALARQAESVPRAPPPPPVSIDRERNRVLVAEALHRAAAAANAGSLDGACAQLAEAETLLACSPSMLARDSLCLALHDVLAAATQRLDAAIADVKGRSAAALLDKLPASPGGAQSSPNSVLNAFVGGAAPSSREALKPRTFCVTLPFGSLGGATSASSRGEPSSAGSSQHAAGPSSAGSSHGVPRDGAASSPSARAPGARTPRGAAAAAAAAAAATRLARCGRGGRRRCASRLRK